MQEAGHSQGIEKTDEEGGKLPVDLVKMAKSVISPERSHRQSCRLRCACSFETQLRRNAGQFLSSIRITSASFRGGDIPAADFQRHYVVVVAVQTSIDVLAQCFDRAVAIPKAETHNDVSF
jgi:hypothetical protein